VQAVPAAVQDRDNRTDGAVGSSQPDNEIEVVERRLDGLINTGLLQTGAEAPLYHNVVTREDIERLGVTNMEELFRYIPQTSSAVTDAQTAVGQFGQGERFANISLRGFPSAQTVVLVNGRALPRTGVGNGSGPDINRIPVAAIERIEILPYSGSAIYGAGAIGGAVNIILRKNYSGQDLTAYVGTSMAGGADEYRMTYVNGRSFNDGRTSVTFTASMHRRSDLRLGDRDYLDRAFNRYGPDSTERIRPGGPTAFEAYIIPAVAGAPATIVAGSGAADLGIPGHPGVRIATVPVGTSPEQSTALTPGSFTGTAGNYTSDSSRYDRMLIYEPRDTYSVNAQIEHTIIPRRLEAYGEFTAGLNQSKYTAPEVTSLSLSRTDPLNPFRNENMGGDGRNVIVYFDTPDIMDASYDRELRSGRAVLGLRGSITKDWEWSADGLIDYMDSDQYAFQRAGNGVVSLLRLSIFDPNGSTPPNPAPAEERRAVYPILADHDQYPISAEVANAYFGTARYTPSTVNQREGNFRLTGDLYQLPAGTLRTSLLGRLRHFERDSSFAIITPNAMALAVTGEPAGAVTQQSPILSKRATRQGGAELVVPVFGRDWRPVPFIQGLDLNLSYSMETNDSSGINQSSGQPFDFEGETAKTYVAALKLQITPDIALRGSYTDGFYPPGWGDISDGRSTFDFLREDLFGFFDPLRGGIEMVDDTGVNVVVVSNGGNPDLRPESAETVNIGAILKPRFLPGLTMTVDYWRTEKTDAIIRTNFVQLLSQLADFQDFVTRGPASPEDMANGWAGPVTNIFTGPVNISSLETDGADMTVRYDRDLGAFGMLMFNTNAVFTNHFQTRNLPSSPLVETAGAGGPIRWRGYASVSWNRAALGATLTGRYVGEFSSSTTTPTPAFPNASGLDGDKIPAFINYDLQLTYEVRGAQGGMFQWLVDDSRWTLGINNLFDKAPTLISNTQSGFYNRQVDPRQRFAYLSYRKSF
jgi:outer membrane receptor protein involved in Fe transport